MVVSGQGGPKTRGYSLRTRSQVSQESEEVAKENVIASKVQKQSARSTRKTVPVLAVKENTENVVNTRRSTRAQTMKDMTTEDTKQRSVGATKPKRKGRACNQKTSPDDPAVSNAEVDEIEVVKEQGNIEEVIEEPRKLEGKDNVHDIGQEKVNYDECVRAENEVGAIEGSDQILKVDLVEDKTPAYTETKEPEHEESKPKEKDKKSFFDLPQEEQVLIVRKKLERIIHGKEKNQSKSVDLLRILERMDVSEKILADTKIDLTLEALKFIVKDHAILNRTESLLETLKKSKKKSDVKVVDKKWRCPREEKREESIKTSHDKMIEKVDSSEKKKIAEKEEKKEEKHIKDKIPSTKEKLKSLIKSIEKLEVGDEKVYYYLKDISYLDMEVLIGSSRLTGTLRKLKHSSHEKTQRLARKVVSDLKNFNNNKQESLDNLADNMSSLKLASKERKEDKSVQDLSKIVEKVQIGENRVRKEGEKLFATPFKLKTKTIVDHPKPVASTDSDLLRRLKHLELENNLHKYKLRLDDFKTENDDKNSMMSMLQELYKANVTLELLETTKIGLSLNHFRKITDDQEMAQLGKNIIKKWKTLVPAGSKEENSQEREKQKEKQEKENIEKIRSHCRSLLVTALNSNKNIPPSSNVDVDKLGAAIEEAIFERFKGTNQKYRSQVHSRQYNIRSNQTLCENIVVGKISPDEVAVMTHEDMANDDLKKMREDLVKKGFDCLPKTHSAGDKFCTCRICLPPWIQQ